MKKQLLIVLCVVLVFALAACSTSETPDASQAGSESVAAVESQSQAATESQAESADITAYPPLNLDPTEVYGPGPNGEEPTNPADMAPLTDEEKQQLKDGNFKVAFCYHMLSNQVNETKAASCKEALEALGVEVVAMTDAGFDATTLISQIESTMALDPDVMVSFPVDVQTTASTYKNVLDAGTKLVFMEQVPTGFVAGTDYASCVNSDSYGNGKVAAEIMAENIGYEGEVGMVYYDVPFYVTNERDRAFRETIESEYPDITIVNESGFTDPNQAGTNADAMLASYPDLKGIYVSWDDPCAQQVVASAKSAGREDIVITTVDCGDATSVMVATGGMIRGTASPRSYDQGQAEALAVCYALLEKDVPPYIAIPTLPVVQGNILEAYQICYHTDPPSWLTTAVDSVE